MDDTSTYLSVITNMHVHLTEMIIYSSTETCLTDAALQHAICD